MNKVILIGNIGKDAELRFLPDGTAACNFSVATNRRWKDKDGDLKEEVEWHSISMLGTRAQSLSEYLTKGTKVAVEGRIRTRKWTDKDGVTRYSTEVVAQDVELLGGKPTEGQAGGTGASQKPSRQAESNHGGFDDMDDDIPF